MRSRVSLAISQFMKLFPITPPSFLPFQIFLRSNHELLGHRAQGRRIPIGSLPQYLIFKM